jgi:hypothetical protein
MMKANRFFNDGKLASHQGLKSLNSLNSFLRLLEALFSLIFIIFNENSREILPPACFLPFKARMKRMQKQRELMRNRLNDSDEFIFISA